MKCTHGLCLIVLVATTPSTAPAGEKESVFAGKVVAGKTAGALSLVSPEGKTYTLINDDHSRLFFEVPSLRNRAVRLTGHLEKGALRVTSVQSVVAGKVHDVYYWCDNCQLAYFKSGKCQCCGSEVKLREVEVVPGKMSPVLLGPE